MDDSKLIREAMSRIFSATDSVRVVAKAKNGFEALDAVKKMDPDVVTLDISMPYLDGLSTLKYMMIHNPKPTVMISNLTTEGSATAFDALRYGAMDIISKSFPPGYRDFASIDEQIYKKVEFAASVKVNTIKYLRVNPQTDKQVTPQDSPCRQIVAMGANEGGFGALLKIVPWLYANPTTAYLAVLYSTRDQVNAFADYLNKYSSVQVKSARHGETVCGGVCYLCSGEDYLTVHSQRNKHLLHVYPAPFVSRKGSVDMLMFSAADIRVDRVMGVVLSGSGEDGVEGLEEISRIGGLALVQSPETCLSREMPSGALKRNGDAIEVADLRVASTINSLFATGR